MAQNVDVVVAGGGVIGSAVAYFLTAARDFDGRVLVVERDPAYQTGSTARSVACIRQQFSEPTNIRMSQFTIEFISRLGEYLGIEGETPDIAFRPRSYLFLASPEGRDVLRSNHAVQIECGADIAFLEPHELARRFAWLNTSGLAAGCLGLSGEGGVDPYFLLQAFKRKARQQGAQFIDDEVVGCQRSGSSVTAVRLRKGGYVPCGRLVNAAGPCAADIGELVGVDIPVRPRKRFIFVFDCRAATIDNCPLTIDPTGTFFRSEGEYYLCGVSPPPQEDPDCLDFEIDYTYFDERIWPVLAERVPAFEAIKLINAWAGHYAYNTLDQNAIIGAHPEVSNFYLANGFSGHGLQQSPAVGRAIAELIVHGEYRSLDVSALDVQRVIENRPVRELNIV
jgi:sarcosine oxidase